MLPKESVFQRDTRYNLLLIIVLFGEDAANNKRRRKHSNESATVILIKIQLGPVGSRTMCDKRSCRLHSGYMHKQTDPRQ